MQQISWELVLRLCIISASLVVAIGNIYYIFKKEITQYIYIRYLFFIQSCSIIMAVTALSFHLSQECVDTRTGGFRVDSNLYYLCLFQGVVYKAAELASFLMTGAMIYSTLIFLNRKTDFLNNNRTLFIALSALGSLVIVLPMALYQALQPCGNKYFYYIPVCPSQSKLWGYAFNWILPNCILLALTIFVLVKIRILVSSRETALSNEQKITLTNSRLLGVNLLFLLLNIILDMIAQTFEGKDKNEAVIHILIVLNLLIYLIPLHNAYVIIKFYSMMFLENAPSALNSMYTNMQSGSDEYVRLDNSN